MEGVRALAALSVVVVHAASAAGAFSVPVLGALLARTNIGVTVFFLISGFLLYRPMIAARGGGAPAPATRRYLWRRFLRIFPAYWAILTVLLVVPGLGHVSGGGLWTMYGLVDTLGFTHGPTCEQQAFRCGLAHTWSLVAELTFYLLLPLFAIALARLTRRFGLQAWIWTQLTTLGVLSAASVLAQLGHVPTLVSGSVGGYVWWFALGMAFAVLSVAERSGRALPAPLQLARAHPGALWLLAAGLYAALSAWLPATPFLLARGQVMGAHVIYGLIAALVLLPAVFDAGTGWPRRLLAHPLAAWLGLISYGIFLWHYEITLKLGPDGAKLAFVPLLTVTLVLSVACAAASYYALERPLLRLKYARARRAQRPEYIETTTR
jgi:peptidoglycan/LPS O-acetylase OafA/YrhL